MSLRDDGQRFSAFLLGQGIFGVPCKECNKQSTMIITYEQAGALPSIPMIIPSEAASGISGMRAGLDVATVICTNCGNVRLFSAQIMRDRMAQIDKEGPAPRG